MMNDDNWMPKTCSYDVEGSSHLLEEEGSMPQDSSEGEDVNRSVFVKGMWARSAAFEQKPLNFLMDVILYSVRSHAFG